MIHHLQEADKPCSKRSHFRSRGLCFKMSNAWHVISSFLGCFSFYGHTYIPFGHRHLSEELSHLTSLYRSKIQACFRQMFHRLAYHEFAIQLCVLLSWLQQQVPYIFRMYSVPITALKKFWKAMPTEVKIAIHDRTKYQKKRSSFNIYCREKEARAIQWNIRRILRHCQIVQPSSKVT